MAQALAIVKVRFYFIEDLDVMPATATQRLCLCVCVCGFVACAPCQRFHAMKSFFCAGSLYGPRSRLRRRACFVEAINWPTANEHILYATGCNSSPAPSIDTQSVVCSTSCNFTVSSKIKPHAMLKIAKANASEVFADCRTRAKKRTERTNERRSKKKPISSIDEKRTCSVFAVINGLWLVRRRERAAMANEWANYTE